MTIQKKFIFLISALLSKGRFSIHSLDCRTVSGDAIVCLFLALKARKHSQSFVWFGERYGRDSKQKQPLVGKKRRKKIYVF
jgi:hypothetical protein